MKVIGFTGNPELVQFRIQSKTSRSKVEIEEMHESEYDQHLKSLKKDQSLRLQIKKLTMQTPSLDDSLLTKSFKRPLVFIKNNVPTVSLNRQLLFSQTVLQEAYNSQIQFFNAKKTAFMVLSIDGVKVKLIIELYKDQAPKACDNFLQFCNGIKIKDNLYSYRGLKFMRYYQNAFLQAGFKEKISAFGDYFEDESYSLKHNMEGIIGMANDGYPHTNTNQFYITLAAIPWFDRKRVAFGKIISGMKELQKTLKSCINIQIVDCGIYKHENTVKIKLERQNDDFHTIIPAKALTFNQFIIQEQQKHSDALGDFSSLLLHIKDLFQQSAEYIYQDQKQCFDLCQQFAKHTALLYLIDNQQVYQGDNGKYLVALKMVDGTDGCRGSAFVIFKKQTTQFKEVNINDFKQTGEQIVGAGYCVYGKTTQFLIGIGFNLTIFTLSGGEFLLTQQEITIPKEETFYNSHNLQKYVGRLQLPLKQTDSVFTTLHRIICLGGIAELDVSIFEALIAGFVITRAWGMCFTEGTSTINQVKVKDVRLRSYLYLGQQKYIQKIENAYLQIK